MSDSNFKWDGVILRCIDARTSDAVQVALQELNLHHCDVISVAGSVKNIVEESLYLLSQVEISHRLHSPAVIVLFAHEDCGAYGGSQTYGKDPVREQKAHEQELLHAAKVIHSRFPDMKIVKVYLCLSGEVHFID